MSTEQNMIDYAKRRIHVLRLLHLMTVTDFEIITLFKYMRFDLIDLF